MKSAIPVLPLVLLLVCHQEKVAPTRFADETQNTDVVASSNLSQASPLDVELYIDATSSMAGFAAAPDGVFNRFVEEIEGAIESYPAKSKIDFFKFGTRVQSIDRDTAMLHRDAAFFRELGIYEQTRIEEAVANADPAKVRILLTDLFQTEGDVNRVVAVLKEKCFERGIDIGILLVRADFNGMIYDANVPPFRYSSTDGDIKSYRPFFAIFIGKAEQFSHLYQALKATELRPSIDDRAFLILSSRIVADYSIAIGKKRGTDLVVRKLPWEDRFRNTFFADLAFSEAGQEITLNIEVKPQEFSPPLQLTKLRLNTWSLETGASSKPEKADHVQLKSVVANDGGVAATIILKTTGKPRPIAYKLLFQLLPLEGYALPSPFVENSTRNPRPDNDANKTLNLEKFTRDLVRSWASVQQGYVAKAYLHLNLKKK